MAHPTTRGAAAGSAAGRSKARSTSSARTRAARAEDKELKEIVVRLKTARDFRSMGSRELSEAAGLSTGTVTAIECGHYGRVEVRTLIRLAKALRVSRAWLETGVGEMVLPADSEDGVQVVATTAETPDSTPEAGLPDAPGSEPPAPQEAISAA